MLEEKNVGPKNVMETMFSKLDQFLKTETVIGEPFSIGSITLVPIISVAFGMAGGLGEGSDKKGGDGTGGGGGLGCRITPNAILVIKGEEVDYIELKNRGSLEKLFDAVPDLLSKIQEKKEEEGEEE